MHFIITLVLGALAGWIAGKIMKSEHSLLINLILGLVGGAIGGWIGSLLGISGGWIVGLILAGLLAISADKTQILTLSPILKARLWVDKHNFSLS